MVNHVTIVEPKEGKRAVEWALFLEMEMGSVKVTALENIHHGEVDVESKEDEEVERQLDVNNC